MSKVIIIGSGVAGMAVAIRLQARGFEVIVFEKNTHPGGKLNQKIMEGFRFDLGPSLFTRPDLIDELVKIAKMPANVFNYKKLDTLCNYFFSNGKKVSAPSNLEDFVNVFESELGEPKTNTRKFLKKAQEINNIAGKVFLENSLHKVSTYLKSETLNSMAQIHRIDSLRTMNSANTKAFKTPEAVQFFNRFATYNGSNPFKTPATLNLISTLEMQDGAFLPKNGMYQITQTLFDAGKKLGVVYHFNQAVSKIVNNKNQVKGIETEEGVLHEADIVISNMDSFYTFQKLLGIESKAKKIKALERSSSALIFYWGINKEFPELDLHNIFFSAEYQNEFEHIFDIKEIFDDPTVYINITSKHIKEDAPNGMENWFVMINAPAKPEIFTPENIAKVKESILAKLEKILSKNIRQNIVVEDVLTPGLIESRTSSYLGALYGTASNQKFSAFFRTPNFSSQIKGLYFCGGSVHPGGGIPLCLLSAKIVDSLIK